TVGQRCHNRVRVHRFGVPFPEAFCAHGEERDVRRSAFRAPRSHCPTHANWSSQNPFIFRPSYFPIAGFHFQKECPLNRCSTRTFPCSSPNAKRNANPRRDSAVPRRAEGWGACSREAAAGTSQTQCTRTADFPGG